MTDKKSTTFRLSDDARVIIGLLAQKLGVSNTDVIEISVRKLAQAEGVQLPPKK